MRKRKTPEETAEQLRRELERKRIQATADRAEETSKHRARAMVRAGWPEERT